MTFSRAESCAAPSLRLALLLVLAHPERAHGEVPPQCKTFAATDFAGHDLTEVDENTAAGSGRLSRPQRAR
jgi:hypothetical protein